MFMYKQHVNNIISNIDNMALVKYTLVNYIMIPDCKDNPSPLGMAS